MPIIRLCKSIKKLFSKSVSIDDSNEVEAFNHIVSEESTKEYDFENFRLVFQQKIKGKSRPKGKHNGSLGHWIESQFGVSHNSIPGADLDGFEIKSGSQKGTYGDWMGDWYIWYDENSCIPTRNDFLRTFGSKKRVDRPERYSWTKLDLGKHVSDEYSESGQRMLVSSDNDIRIYYNFLHDSRSEKFDIIPELIRNGDVMIAQFSREKMSKLVKDKFGIKGWVYFSVKKDNVDSLYLGHPFDFEDWIEWVKSGHVELDSGMNTDTSRNRSSFRSKSSFWKDLAFEIIQ
tara:strand:- start:614 stop:1477 length:864 start_codon:yes stop_codon:yes gene_type:complete